MIFAMVANLVVVLAFSTPPAAAVAAAVSAPQAAVPPPLAPLLATAATMEAFPRFTQRHLRATAAAAHPGDSSELVAPAVELCATRRQGGGWMFAALRAGGAAGDCVGEGASRWLAVPLQRQDAVLPDPALH
jgi:hypothetical protein